MAEPNRDNRSATGKKVGVYDRPGGAGAFFAQNRLFIIIGVIALVAIILYFIMSR